MPPSSAFNREASGCGYTVLKWLCGTPAQLSLACGSCGCPLPVASRLAPSLEGDYHFSTRCVPISFHIQNDSFVHCLIARNLTFTLCVVHCCRLPILAFGIWQADGELAAVHSAAAAVALVLRLLGFPRSLGLLNPSSFGIEIPCRTHLPWDAVHHLKFKRENSYSQSE